MKTLKTSLLVLLIVSFISSAASATEPSKECTDFAQESLALIEKGVKKGDKHCIAADADETNDPVLFQKCTKYSAEKMSIAKKCQKESEGMVD